MVNELNIRTFNDVEGGEEDGFEHGEFWMDSHA